MSLQRFAFCLIVVLVGGRFFSEAISQDVSRLIPDASPLTITGDVASQLVDGVDRFLQSKIDRSLVSRNDRWQRDFRSVETYHESVAKNRVNLRSMIGVVDERPADGGFVSEIDADLVESADSEFQIRWVRWPVLEDPDPNRTVASVWGEGLLIEPKDRDSVTANVIAIGDCDRTPGQVCGLVDGVAAESQFGRHLAERRCRVLVPMLVSRHLQRRGGRAELTNREYLYRSSFELGRHLIGYEVQMVLAAADRLGSELPLGLAGVGEGGRIAMYTAAIDQRFDAVLLSGCLGDAKQTWQKPIDRNVFGLLNEFGDAELLTLIAPRDLLVQHVPVEPINLDGSGGGAPGRIEPIPVAQGNQEVRRARQMMKPWVASGQWQVDELSEDQTPASTNSIEQFLSRLIGQDALTSGSGRSPKPFIAPNRYDVEEAAKQNQLIQRIDRHNQLLLRESPFSRRSFMSQLDTGSIEAYEKSVERYRQIFRDDVIGHFEDPVLKPNPRVRKTWDEERWTGYEVVLDVFPDVIAYGVLIVPKGIAPGEKRPVVVCQHGLEGRPTDTFLGDHRAYHDFAAKLAERGFITFAPQNLYLFKDRFRTLQRKANLTGKTLFSVIIPQHQQIVDWLQTLPAVDPNRIGFYGLSYGGKSAMRIPALVTDYCLSICSADFNEWVRKNASTRHPFSYVWTGEYEIFEWNLGSTFNYAEMSALICPRPFMVERGHFDGVGTDEWVAYEYAKVRNLYAAQLKIPERTEIEWFDGPHTINGKGTFDFLHKHLDWPEPRTAFQSQPDAVDRAGDQ